MNTPQLLPAGMAPHPHRSSDCPKGKCCWVGGQKEPGCEGHRTGHCAERGGYRKGNPGEAHVCLTVTVTSISACGNNSLMVSLLFLPVQLCNVRGAPLGSNDRSLAETSAQQRVVPRKVMHTCQLLPAPPGHHPERPPVSGPVSSEAAGSPLGLVARSAGLVAGRTPACPHSCVDGLGSACEQECGASLVQACARVSGARAVLGQRSC